MRYRDASHVNAAAFYGKHPRTGQAYRAFGLLTVVLAVASSHDLHAVLAVLALAVVAWALAWQRGVGPSWRSTLVAAMVCCAAILTLHRLKDVDGPVGRDGRWVMVDG